MVFREIEIKREGTLSPKDASAITHRALRYESEILIESGTQKANAKSIMGFISLGLKGGSRIVVICKGADEAEALEEIVGLFS